MIFVDNEKTNDPTTNLAIEEYLLRNQPLEGDLLLLYVNEPSIIIGRYQNALEEINRAYVEEHGIQVVRRLSGGGAVYHDRGNLCFSLITRGGKEDALNFKKFTAPVIHALVEMGIPAELGSRNDILVEGRKISGNAIYSTKAGILCHGTLLFDTDLSRLEEALKVKAGKIESKSIKSVRSSVANLNEYLPKGTDIETFRQRLLGGIFTKAGEIPEYRLSEKDWEAVQGLAEGRYRRWEWNYGKSPAFKVQKRRHFASGEIEARIEVEAGLIHSVELYGDFIEQGEAADLERLLRGVRYEGKALQAALEGIEVGFYFKGVANSELVEFLY
jgi:lipoate-protein ligase A